MTALCTPYFYEQLIALRVIPSELAWVAEEEVLRAELVHATKGEPKGELCEGAAEVLEELHQDSVTCSIVTSKGGEFVRAEIERQGYATCVCSKFRKAFRSPSQRMHLKTLATQSTNDCPANTTRCASNQNFAVIRQCHPILVDMLSVSPS